MVEPIRFLPGTRSLAMLADSLAAIRLLQEELLRAKRTYTDIAKAAGVANSTVSNIATGSTKWPRLETIIRILGALDWVIVAQRRT
jgi:transcriptional regulator with XRE-family HTH domain